ARDCLPGQHHFIERPSKRDRDFQKSQEQAQYTGEEGEYFAYLHFVANFGALYDVQWMNYSRESGSHYDILLTHRKSGTRTFIEVKSTSRKHKPYFEVSRIQYEWATDSSID
ncbi:hypothetical protein L195_g061087, partial [Trifolium pratense]